HIASRLGTRKVFGFDSFWGLKEAWSGTAIDAGYFSRDGKLPAVASNVELVAGWFDETLPRFLQEHNQTFALLHIDCDTYQSTKTVLDLVAERIIAGTIIIFDEYLNVPGWRHGQFKAWRQFVELRKIAYRYVAFSSLQAAVQIS